MSAASILRSALVRVEADVDNIFKESAMTRDGGVKIKTELPDSVECTICKARTSVDTATDVYTKVSHRSDVVFASLISKLTNIAIINDDPSKFLCKRCFCLLLKIDETESEYLRLKKEFHDIYVRTAEFELGYMLFKAVSTQTGDEADEQEVFNNEEERYSPSPAASPARSFTLDGCYDSDSEPLSKKKSIKKHKKAKKSKRLKQKSSFLLDYTCEICNVTFESESLLTNHIFYNHPTIETDEKINIERTHSNDLIEHKRKTRRKGETETEIIPNHIKQELDVENAEDIDVDLKENIVLPLEFSENDTVSSTSRPTRAKRRHHRSQLIMDPEENDEDTKASNESIDLRIRRKKREPKPMFQCPECPEMLKTKAKLKCHMEQHGTEKPPFICEICGASYKNKKACDIHVGMHKGISPWKCDQCAKLFPSKGALQRHEAIHTGKTNYQCDLCGKSFIHTSSFKMHKLSHSGVKPHACHVCGLSLMTKSHLKRHARAHSGEKRHECQTCGKKFSERYNLHAHQKSHTGLQQGKPIRKSFKCTVCENAFERRYLLEKHMEIAHNTVMDKGPKKPRMTMSRLLKMQATSGNTAVPNVPAAQPSIKPMDIESKPVEINQSTQETFKTSPRDSPAAPNEEPQTSARAISPIHHVPFRLGQETANGQPPVWPGQPPVSYHHLANDFPLRMHGLDYSSYIGKQ